MSSSHLNSSQTTEAEKSITQMIREEFEISDEEDLLDDFGCSLNDGSIKNVAPHGRLYLTDRCLCFCSNILGYKNKVKIPFDEILSISKTKVLGLFDSGITVTCSKEQHVICGFRKRDIALERIMAIWTSRGNNQSQ